MALKFTSLTPQDCTPTTCSLAPTRPQTGRLPESPGSLTVCFPALPESEKTPATFRVPFLCAVRSRPPVLHAGQPRCKHSHHPRIPSLAPVRGHCGLSAAALDDSGVIRAEPQSPLRMHWRSPRRGTLRQTRRVFALHPSPPKAASPGSGQGCPAFRPFGRFSPVAAEPSLRTCRPKSRLQKRLALRRHPGSRAVAAAFARRPRPF
jgi:hypothetical protein